MSCMKQGILIVACIFCAVIADAKSLSVGSKKITLPGAGVEFNGFLDLQAVPKIVPERTSIWRSRQTKTKIYGYDVIDLWRHDQIEGVWKNPAVTLTVATMRTPLPIGVRKINAKHDDVERKEYLAWKRKHISQIDEDSYERWCEFLLYARLKKQKQKIGRKAFRCTLFRGGTESAWHEVFLILPYRGSRDPIIFDFAFKRKITRDDAKAIGNFLDSIRLRSIGRVQNKQVWTSGHYSAQNWSDKYRESRRRAIESIRNMRDWWFLESRNYVMVSNLRDQRDVRKIQKHLEKSREAFEVLFPLARQINDVSVVRVFKERKDYTSYVKPGSRQSVGVWYPYTKELLISAYKTKNYFNQIKSTTTHEGFHQFVFYALNKNNTSHWFNEGTATFFEGISFSGISSFKIGLSDRYSNFMKLYRSGDDKILPLLYMDGPTFYRDVKNYDRAWALMFYLYKGAYVTNNKKYLEIPFKYYNAVLKGLKPEEATKIAWRGINIKQFQQDFRKFWGNPQLIANAASRSIKQIHNQSRRFYYK